MIVSLGDLMVDAYFQIPDRRNPRTDTQGRVELAAGGSAANFAVWIARHGRKSGLIGRVGCDFLGRALVADLEHEGVCPYLAFDPDLDYGTGRVGVIVAADGERDMVCDRRANARLSVEDIPEDVVAGAEWLQRLIHAFPKFAWINPEPQGVWQYRQSIAVVQQIVHQRMYPLTLKGLEDAMRLLSK